MTGTNSATNSATNRNTKIDLLRGWLILLVIVGHVVLGSVHDNSVRYTIYAFHMPLFIGLAGYLINTGRLRQTRISALLARYWWRVLLPFSLAFIVFTGVLVYHAWDENRLTQSLLVSYLVTPYYHLWFVPTLVLWVLALWTILKLKCPVFYCLLVATIFSLLWAVVNPIDLTPLLAVLLSKKVVYFFTFFLFGVWLRTKPGQRFSRAVTSFKTLPVAVLILCAVIYLINIGPDKSLAKGCVWLLMNLALMVVCIAWAIGASSRKTKNKAGKGGLTKVSAKATLVSMGRVSLPIYLWHVLPLFLLKGFDLHIESPGIYYSCSIVSIALIVWGFIILENRSPIVSRLFYGVRPG